MVAKQYVHTVSTTPTVLCMGSASSHKTFLSDHSSDMAKESDKAPDSLKTAYCVEASTKGIRTCILNQDRVSATSDEIGNSFPTPWGDHKESKTHVNHLCRSKLCTYTQGERDDLMTAHGPVHLQNYAFQGK